MIIYFETKSQQTSEIKGTGPDTRMRACGKFRQFGLDALN